jgi:hypothetical protein
MPAEVFHGGDNCSLSLEINNPGTARNVDLYVLLDVSGNYYAYPGWSDIAGGLEHQDLTITAASSDEMVLISPFTMPPVPAFGPLFFYAAMFDDGFLDLDHLASNGSAWEFHLLP